MVVMVSDTLSVHLLLYMRHVLRVLYLMIRRIPTEAHCALLDRTLDARIVGSECDTELEVHVQHVCAHVCHTLSHVCLTRKNRSIPPRDHGVSPRARGRPDKVQVPLPRDASMLE